jgi:hypothetical protein
VSLFPAFRLHFCDGAPAAFALQFLYIYIPPAGTFYYVSINTRWALGRVQRRHVTSPLATGQPRSFPPRLRQSITIIITTTTITTATINHSV